MRYHCTCSSNSLTLLGLGQAAAEVFGHLDDEHEERRVRPVEGLGVQGVIAAALAVDSLDGGVVALDLPAGLGGAVAVVDHTHDRVHRAGHSLQRFAQQDGVFFDTRAQFRVHVLDRADPDAHHPGAQISEVLPRQRVGPERVSRRRCRCDCHDGLQSACTAITISVDNVRCPRFRHTRRTVVTHSPQRRRNRVISMFVASAHTGWRSPRCPGQSGPNTLAGWRSRPTEQSPAQPTRPRRRWPKTLLDGGPRPGGSATPTAAQAW